MKRIILAIIIIFISFQMKAIDEQALITVIGTGYVGLTTGVGLAEIGNNVICADIDCDKVEKLQKGIISIHEPGLEELVRGNIQSGRLRFTYDVESAIKDASVIFIAVGTPMGNDGSADLSFIESVATTIANKMDAHKYICIKSTVPVGTGAWVRLLLEEKGVDPNRFDMISNPEFLREGSAVSDFLYPDRIVIGVESDRAGYIMKSVYKHFIDNKTPILFTNVSTSEMIKYASNSFLAVKISYINELSNLCDKVGANISEVAYAMGLDHRISPHFLKPGPGFGGSCFPKDCNALLKIAREHDNQLQVVQASLEANEHQKDITVEKLKSVMAKREKSHDVSLANKTVAILGLAFKANTDDVRYSPAQHVIELLRSEKSIIRTYDPFASENMKNIYPDLYYCNSSYEALQGADACIIMTEWEEFKYLDFENIYMIMNQPILIDSRGIIDRKRITDLGFIFDSIGQKDCDLDLIVPVNKYHVTG